MPATFQAPSAAVIAARARRAANADASDVQIQWFTEEVVKKVSLTMEQRVRIATEFIRSKVVTNISRSVTIGTGPRGGRVVANRSLPGEYPKADTTLLMKTIFGEVREVTPGVFEGYVGTPLDYGLILETILDRSFLVRTLRAKRLELQKILSDPINPITLGQWKSHEH